MNTTSDVSAVGLREPCPCGSGKRYKACHGKRAKQRATEYVAKPFAGLPNEGDWIALREIVPAATAQVRLAGEHAERDVVAATVLPMAVPALLRQSGQIMLGMQTPTSTGDPSAELGHVLTLALQEESPGAVAAGPAPTGGPRLQDLVDTSVGLDVTVHENFEFWLDEDDPSPEVRASLEQANAAVQPTARLQSVSAAYWCQLGDRDQLRWVLPYDEERLLDGLARLHAEGADLLGEGTRLLGTFRAHGRLVPVWDLVEETMADEVEKPAAAFAERLEQAVAETSALTGEQRRARSGLANRQVTLR